MPQLRVLDLFSGIGGFSLGLERTSGFKTVAFCEIEPFPRRVLAKHWPEVPCYDDVRTLTAERLRTDGIGVDVITGGFPCQDLSGAGARAGIDGERSGLWREIARLARDLRPSFIILENVADLLDGPSEQPGGWFGALLGFLAEIGFDAQWRCIPASAVGAEHDRDRVWVVSYPNTFDGQERLGLLLDDQATLFAAYHRNRHSVWLETTLPSPRMADGISAWLDRRERTEGLGNAVVPQIPELIGNAILASMAAQPC